MSRVPVPEVRTSVVSVSERELLKAVELRTLPSWTVLLARTEVMSCSEPLAGIVRFVHVTTLLLFVPLLDAERNSVSPSRTWVRPTPVAGVPPMFVSWML